MKETLAYFTSKDFPPYSLLQIPVRGKTIPGLVISTRDLREAKAEVKAENFALKKILHGERTPRTDLFLLEFLEAASQTARYFRAVTGAVVAALAPARILEEYAKGKNSLISIVPHPIGEPLSQERGGGEGQDLKQDKLVLMQDDADRVSTYRGLIREEFVHGRSVFLAVPEVLSAEKIFSELSRGIEQYAFLFHGKIPWKALRGGWKKALSEKHPILVVGTPQAFSLPRRDIGLIILDEEDGGAYKTFARPYFDMRYFIEAFAEKLRVKIILGSSFLRTETWCRHEERELIHCEPLRLRIQTSVRREIIDARKGANTIREDGEFRGITPALEAAIRKELPLGNIFLYGVRRGLSPLTLCRDCGVIVSCPRCSAPITLHKGAIEGDNFFLCHKCGHRRSAADRCAYCHSWRLKSLGIGIESASGEAKKLFPEAKIIEISSDADAARERKEIPPRGAIIIGTKKALHKVEGVSISAALSLDPLFLLPDFRMHERIFRTLLEIQSKTEKAMYVQTRRPDEEIFSAWKQGDLLRAYRHEVRERERFAYPPFSLLVKISWSGDEKAARARSEYMRKLFAQYSPRIFPAFTQRVRNRWRINCLLKFPKSSWPNEEALRSLFSLPPDFTVEVDPEDLL